jgi:hypothetical protein
LTFRYGTTVSLFLPLPVSMVISWIAPDQFSWNSFNQIEVVEADGAGAVSPSVSEAEDKTSGSQEDGEKGAQVGELDRLDDLDRIQANVRAAKK